MKKTWNIPEMTELTIKATAGGGKEPMIEDSAYCGNSNQPFGNAKCGCES